eukprot:781874-Pleurochrysis_carterae.AAC.1
MAGSALEHLRVPRLREVSRVRPSSSSNVVSGELSDDFVYVGVGGGALETLSFSKRGRIGPCAFGGFLAALSLSSALLLALSRSPPLSCSLPLHHPALTFVWPSTALSALVLAALASSPTSRRGLHSFTRHTLAIFDKLRNNVRAAPSLPFDKFRNNVMPLFFCKRFKPTGLPPSQTLNPILPHRSIPRPSNLYPPVRHARSL